MPPARRRPFGAKRRPCERPASRLISSSARRTVARESGALTQVEVRPVASGGRTRPTWPAATPTLRRGRRAEKDGRRSARANAWRRCGPLLSSCLSAAAAHSPTWPLGQLGHLASSPAPFRPYLAKHRRASRGQVCMCAHLHTCLSLLGLLATCSPETVLRLQSPQTVRRPSANWSLALTCRPACAQERRVANIGHSQLRIKLQQGQVGAQV